mgnify:CR=1 FL=1
MKTTVQHLHSSFNRSYEIKSPGATFGRSHDNQIALPDPSISISLFQAAIKIKDGGQIELRNLAATPILVGNQSLRVGQSFDLQSDSEFTCGDFKFQLESAPQAADKSKAASDQPSQSESPSFKTPTVMPMPGTETILPVRQTLAPSTPLVAQIKETAPNTFESPEIVKEKPESEKSELASPAELAITPTPSVEEPVPSVFDDLFSGSGVVPIGAEPTHMDVHPFEMRSATTRNSNDPLNQVNGIDLDEDLSKDPLERLSRDGIEHQQRDIFHDTRPSTILHDHQDESNDSSIDDLDKIFSELENYAKVK